MGARISVSSADFIRNIGHWQSEALRHPISITHHGRERLVFAAPEEFQLAAGADSSVVAKFGELSADSEAVLENLDEGFFAFDATLKMKRSNSVSEAFIGRSGELMRGKTPLEILPQPFCTVLSERLQRVIRTRKHETFEATVEDRHITIRVFPLVDGAAVLFSNVTEQFDQRMKVGVGQALCSATNKNSHVAGIKLETNGSIVDVHDSFCEWSGFAREEVTGRRFVELLPTAHRREVTERIEQALAGVVASGVEITLVNRRGGEISGVLSFAPIQLEHITHGVMLVWARANEDAAGIRAA